MKSELAKARDKWFLSEDGKECCEGQTSGQYLHNRLVRAFLAGTNFSKERIQELEAECGHKSISINNLNERIQELEAESSLNLDASAKAYTACGNYQKRIQELKDYLIEFGDHKHGCLAIATNNKEYCNCGFTQALGG